MTARLIATPFLGGEGNDHINGNAGADYLSGGPGNDTIFGGQNEGNLAAGQDAYQHHPPAPGRR